MKKAAVLLVAVAVVLSSASLFAQVAGKQGWMTDSPAGIPGMRMDGSEPVVNVEGTVTKISTIKKAPKFLAMYLKTEGGKATVFMGPKTFVDSQKVQFKAGDQVVVRGLQSKYFYIVAAKITRGNDVMVLRSEDGRPAWVK